MRTNIFIVVSTLLLFWQGVALASTMKSPILIFVSFSMPDESIKGWMKEAEIIHAPVVIRGLVNNSFKETTQKMAELVKENHGGVQLDPTLFTRFGIDKVPAVVVISPQPCLPSQTCADNFDVIYGDVTLDYALTKIADQKDGSETYAKEASQQIREKHNA